MVVRYDESLWVGRTWALNKVESERFEEVRFWVLLEHKELIWPILLGARPLTAAHSPMLCSSQKVLQSCGAPSICDPDAAGMKQSLIGSL